MMLVWVINHASNIGKLCVFPLGYSNDPTGTAHTYLQVAGTGFKEILTYLRVK